MQTITHAETNEDIARCYPVMGELRPHLSERDFVGQVLRQMAESAYRLAMLEDEGAVRALAGYRVSEALAWGRYLYVDDLVTAASCRSRGYGGALLAWLADRARAAGCGQLHLDSGVQRLDAHRFYLREGLEHSSHHFSRRLD